MAASYKVRHDEDGRFMDPIKTHLKDRKKATFLDIIKLQQLVIALVGKDAYREWAAGQPSWKLLDYEEFTKGILELVDAHRKAAEQTPKDSTLPIPTPLRGRRRASGTPRERA